MLFFECSFLTSIKIRTSVKVIGDFALAKCSSLTCIEILSSVTSIGYSTFRGCSLLASSIIPSSVKFLSGFVQSQLEVVQIEINNSLTNQPKQKSSIRLNNIIIFKYIQKVL